MSEHADEGDLARPVGGRVGLWLLAAAAVGGLGQGLASILWNDFAIPGGPEPTEQVIDATLRETPPPKPPAPKAAEAPAAAATVQNQVAEAPKLLAIEPVQNTVDALPKAPFPYASPQPAPAPQVPTHPAAPPAVAVAPTPTPTPSPVQPAATPDEAPT